MPVAAGATARPKAMPRPRLLSVRNALQPAMLSTELESPPYLLALWQSPRRLFCHRDSNLSNIDLNRLQGSAHMANIVLYRVQHLIDMAAKHQFPQGQTEPDGHFRHHMGRYGEGIGIGHYVN